MVATEIRWRGIFAIIGACIFQFSLGTVYTDGNMVPYIISYVRSRVDTTVKLTSVIIIATIHPVCQFILLVPSGMLDRKIGPRFTSLISSVCVSGSVVLSYFTIDESFALVTLTYGIMFGLGVSIGYGSTIACGLKWFPNHRGLASGIVVAGFGFGATIFNPIQTALINPNNYSPTKDGYFTEDSVLNGVKNSFLIIALIYVCLQVIGCLLISEAPADDKVLETFDVNLTPDQVLRKKEFYILWLSFFCTGSTVTFINAMYKTYGQTFIQDDHFLALLGSIISVCNCSGRLIWGQLMDRFTYVPCMTCVTTGMAVFMLSMPACSLGGKVMYSLWCSGLFFCISGSFTLAPSVCAHLFGTKHMALNFGLLFSSGIFCCIVSAIMTSFLMDVIGFNGMFFILGGLCVISLILTCVFEMVRKDEINNKAEQLNVEKTNKNLEIYIRHHKKGMFFK